VITRPLGLTARLRTPPVGQDALFYANIALVVLFFGLFGSRFVLAPGLAVPLTGERAAVQLPTMAGARAGAQSTDVVITIRNAQMVMVDTGVLRLDDLPGWLTRQSRGRTNLRLLVLADVSLPLEDQMKLAAMATAAGFTEMQLAAQPAAQH
jgi:biopolymer transport protein ExbD